MAGEVTRRYPQQLSRSLGFLGNLSITLSFLTPTVSLFLTASVLLTLAGTATFVSFVLAAVASAGAAFCFAELGSAFPVVGGQYSIVMRVLGRPFGWVSFIFFLTLIIFTISASALIFGLYLQPIWPSVPVTAVGCIMIAVATVVGVFGIRFNAKVTGVFLALELVVVLVVVIVGLGNAHQPVSALWSLKSAGPKGLPTTIGTSGVIAGISIALFAYNGYDTAVVFSEETTGHRRNIGRAVLVAFAVAVVAELAAVIAIILGTPSIAGMVNSPAPISYVLQADGGATLNKVISVGVAIALFNAIIASVLAIGRVLYSSARDNAWPEPINRWFASVIQNQDAVGRYDPARRRLHRAVGRLEDRDARHVRERRALCSVRDDCDCRIHQPVHTAGFATAVQDAALAGADRPRARRRGTDPVEAEGVGPLHRRLHRRGCAGVLRDLSAPPPADALDPPCAGRGPGYARAGARARDGRGRAGRIGAG